MGLATGAARADEAAVAAPVVATVESGLLTLDARSAISGSERHSSWRWWSVSDDSSSSSVRQANSFWRKYSNCRGFMKGSSSVGR